MMDDPDELVELYGGRQAIENDMRSAAMDTINALKAIDSLRAALLDSLRDWAQMAPADVARTHVDRRAVASELKEVTRGLGKLKVDVRDLQNAGRGREPFRVPESWHEQRDWFQLVASIT